MIYDTEGIINFLSFHHNSDSKYEDLCEITAISSRFLTVVPAYIMSPYSIKDIIIDLNTVIQVFVRYLQILANNYINTVYG